MGTQTAYWIPTKSAHCGMQFAFLNLLLLLNLTFDACDCRSSVVESQRRSSHHNYYKFPVENDERKNTQEEEGKCSPAAAGSKQLEQGVQLSLVHIYGSCSPLRPANSSWESVESQILERDRLRVQALTSRILGNISESAVSVNIPINTGVQYDTGNYLTWLALGTPREYHVMIIDSGSDITWIRCEPCISCQGEGRVFDPEKSSSFRTIPCVSDTCNLLRNSTVLERSCLVGADCLYTVVYADGSRTSGEFSSDVLTVAADSLHGFMFGCSHDNRGFGQLSGLLGLGMGPTSFPTQTTAKFGGLFSYCLPEYGVANALGSLTFGQSAIPLKAAFTKLVINPQSPSFYYVRLSGISVDGQSVSLPFGTTLKEVKTMLDCGTTVTRLQDFVYDAFRDLFVKKTPDIPRAEGYRIFDTCYTVSKGSQPNFPSVTLHFEDGVSVNLDGDRVMFSLFRDPTYRCLAFARAPFGVNLIGSIQQQGYRVSYDVPNGRIGFTPEICGSH